MTLGQAIRHASSNFVGAARFSARDARAILDGEHTVLIFSLWPTTPIFHRRRETDGPVVVADDGIVRHRTACGRTYWAYDRASNRTIREATWLPAVHAIRIGRPCALCWPDDEVAEL